MKYPIQTIPDRTISSVTVSWRGYANAKGTLYLDNTVISPTNVSIPSSVTTYTWDGIDQTASQVRIEISGSCANIISYEVGYTEEWVPLTPNESYPLPTEPPEISKITFEAKTDPGMSSTMSLFIDGAILLSSGILETPETVIWDLGSPIPVSLLTLTNTGSSTVYIRILTTE